MRIDEETIQAEENLTFYITVYTNRKKIFLSYITQDTSFFCGFVYSQQNVKCIYFWNEKYDKKGYQKNKL